jgi:tetratricopeptide (TPR) repeat protein
VDLAKFSDDPNAASVIEKLGAGQWRKARDAAKELCKREKAAYLDLLIAANEGLALEMIGKGLLKEAGTVIDYLATIAPIERIELLKAQCSAPRSKTPAVANHANQQAAAAWWASTLQVDEAVESAGAFAPSNAELAAIDLLAADSFIPTPSVSCQRTSRLTAELLAVRAACDATGDGRWDDARESLRQLPAQSVFRHWRMFLRGVRCTFEEDFTTARQCFAKLPHAGALARAARTLAPDLNAAGPGAPQGAKTAFFLALTGHPPSWQVPLMNANAALKQGKRISAFKLMTEGLNGRFPSLNPDLPGLLTSNIIPYRKAMGPMEEEEALVFIDDVMTSKWLPMRKRKEMLLEVDRRMCILQFAAIGPLDLDRQWKNIIYQRGELLGVDAGVDSLAMEWLGGRLFEFLEANLPEGVFQPFGLDQRVLQLARAALEGAVRLDPANEPAWMTLVCLLGRAGDTKSRNRLLDDLRRRFPRNKTVLQQTGMLARERKAFEKALGALREAHAIDPLDKDIKCEMAVTLIHRIRELIAKGKASGALWDELDQLAEDRPNPDYLQLSRWMLRVRRSLFDPDPEAAAAARQDALRMAPSAPEFALCEHSLAMAYQIAGREHSRADWDESLAKGPATWPVLCSLIEQACFHSVLGGWNRTCNLSVLARISQLLKTLLRDTLNDDPEGLLDFVRMNENQQGKPLTPFAQILIGDCDQSINQVLNRLVRKDRDSADPTLRLAAMAMEITRIGIRRVPSQTMEELQHIITEAAAIGRTRTLRHAKSLRDYLAPHSTPHGQRPDDFSDDDPLDIGEEEEFESSGPGSLDPEIAAKLGELIMSGDPVVLDALREELINNGVPQEVLDQILTRISKEKKPRKNSRKKSTRQK